MSIFKNAPGEKSRFLWFCELVNCQEVKIIQTKNLQASHLEGVFLNHIEKDE